MHYLFPPFFYSDFPTAGFFWWLFGPLLLWQTIWKGLALWKSARNQQRNWFIALLLINTAGILEILYLSFFQSKPKKALPRPRPRQSK
ncbi:MAG: DUF5652 family protein [Candidatus Beckwithbacteria bacterium]